METSKKVLITGGSGLIGGHLTRRLLADGHEVSHLGRAKRNSVVRTFIWDPDDGIIERGALDDVDVIVHLAGAGIADKRWNARRKREILSSRVDTVRLLIDTLKAKPDHRVTGLISASGISYYGLGDPPAEAFVESDSPANDFMASVTVAWEKEVRKAEPLGIRTVMIRQGVVLTPSGGALKKLAMPVRFFVGAPLASGKQYVNWIHIDDLCSLYTKAIEDPLMNGPYNAVTPDPVTNKKFTEALAKVLHRPLWLPPAPGFIVKIIAGEVGEFVLRGGKVSSEKVKKTGLVFQFPTLIPALEDLLNSTRKS